MKNKYATKRELKRQRNTLLLWLGIPLMVTIILALTVTLVLIDKNKYQDVSATVFLNSDAQAGSEGVTLRYVVSGEAYFEVLERVPSKWEDNQLVRIEYLIEDPHVIRREFNVSPFVFLLIFFIVADTIITIKYFPMIRRVLNVKEKTGNDNKPKTNPSRNTH